MSPLLRMEFPTSPVLIASIDVATAGSLWCCFGDEPSSERDGGSGGVTCGSTGGPADESKPLEFVEASTL